MSTESAVVTRTAAEARSTHTPYCWAMTKTFVAVGSAASNTAVCTQTGSNGPIAVSAASISSGCATSFIGTM